MNTKKEREMAMALRNGEMIIENANGYWTEADLRKSYEMFEKGYGITEIALETKRTEVSVMCSLQNRGLFANQCRPRTTIPKEDKPVCLCSHCKVENCDKRSKGVKSCQDYDKVTD